jgi:hypothetical protein
MHVPHINNALDESRDQLTYLAETLPTVRTEVSDIRLVYDSGRQKVNYYSVTDVFIFLIATSSYSGAETRRRSRMVRHRLL